MEKIKKYFKEFVVLLIGFIFASALIGYIRSANIKEKQLGALNSLYTIKNNSVKGLLQQKKPLVLVFWGSWCPVCKEELQTLHTLAKKDNLLLLTIAVESGTDSDIKSFLQKHQVDFPVINDKDGTISKLFNIKIYPSVIYYSQDRKKTLKDSGYTTYLGFLARIKIMEKKNAK